MTRQSKSIAAIRAQLRADGRCVVCRRKSATYRCRRHSRQRNDYQAAFMRQRRKT